MTSTATELREQLELRKLDQEIRTEMARRDHWRAQWWLMAFGAMVGLAGIGLSLLTLVLRLTGKI